jgi:hypothetical protein
VCEHNYRVIQRIVNRMELILMWVWARNNDYSSNNRSYEWIWMNCSSVGADLDEGNGYYKNKNNHCEFFISI